MVGNPCDTIMRMVYVENAFPKMNSPPVMKGERCLRRNAESFGGAIRSLKKSSKSRGAKLIL